jgi:group I intron endonuclease
MMIFISMGHIYQIRNIINNAVYIGSVLKRNPQDRWIRHRKDLRGNCHHSQHLQRAWNKYGESNFVFEIIENVNKNILLREQWHLDKRKKNFPSNLNYNICWTAGNCEGRRYSKKSLQKMSLSHLGQKQTAEAKTKQLLSWEKKCKTPYSFTSPEGIVYSNIRNCRKFAREHNLDSGCLLLLHKEKIYYFKGWIKTGSIRPLYELYSPTGYYFSGMFLKSLCKRNGINYKMIHKYCIKQNKPYQGWMARKIA